MRGVVSVDFRGGSSNPDAEDAALRAELVAGNARVQDALTTGMCALGAVRSLRHIRLAAATTAVIEAICNLPDLVTLTVSALVGTRGVLLDSHGCHEYNFDGLGQLDKLKTLQIRAPSGP